MSIFFEILVFFISVRSIIDKKIEKIVLTKYGIE